MKFDFFSVFYSILQGLIVPELLHSPSLQISFASLRAHLHFPETDLFIHPKSPHSPNPKCFTSLLHSGASVVFLTYHLLPWPEGAKSLPVFCLGAPLITPAAVSISGLGWGINFWFPLSSPRMPSQSNPCILIIPDPSCKHCMKYWSRRTSFYLFSFAAVLALMHTARVSA